MTSRSRRRHVRLGRWRTSDAPRILDLARTAPQEKYRIPRPRYLRIRQMDLPDSDRLAMFHQAFEAATRSEERLLALETLARVPTSETLTEAVNRLDDAALRSMACVAAVTIAERLVRDQAGFVEEPIRRVLAATDDPEITRTSSSIPDNLLRLTSVRQRTPMPNRSQS